MTLTNDTKMINFDELLKGLDVELESEIVYYDSQDGFASIISEHGELLYLDIIH